MHTIGIDHQQTLSIMCLREGTKVRSIGDGKRHIIPHVVDQGGAWGSHASPRSAARKLFQNRSANTCWLNETEGATFWHGLYTRLYTYLGRLEPIPSNGYATIIGVQTQQYQRRVEQIKQWCNSAGFHDITTIPAIDALLCRWLSDPLAEKSGKRVVVAVLVGDMVVDVRAYSIEATNQRYTAIKAASHCVVLDGCGQAWWVERLLRLIEARMHKPLVDVDIPGLWDVANEFGWQLSNATPYQVVTWTGPGQELLFDPLSITRRECASWPEVSSLMARLSAAINDVVSALAESRQPVTVLLGGVGALWPFAREALVEQEKSIPIWQSVSPQEDVAWGATSWYAVGEPYQHILQQNNMPTRSQPFRQQMTRQDNRPVSSSPEPLEFAIDVPILPDASVKNLHPNEELPASLAVEDIASLWEYNSQGNNQ